MPSLFPDLSSLGFFPSRFVLHQIWVPLQLPEPWQKQQTLSSLPPSHAHTNPIFQVYPTACPSQLFFSSDSAAAMSPTPGLYACLTTGSQDGTERCPFTRRKEHAEELKGCVEKQLTPSHTPPRKPPTHAQNPALCWPVSPSEEASFTTETHHHCPQMCREQTSRGPTCVSSKLLLGCWELSIKSNFWVMLFGSELKTFVVFGTTGLQCTAWCPCKNKA